MEGTIMLMSASEAWKKVEKSIEDDLQKIEDAVDEAIKRKSGYATVPKEVVQSEAVKGKLRGLGYKFDDDGYRAFIYFSPNNK